LIVAQYNLQGVQFGARRCDIEAQEKVLIEGIIIKSDFLRQNLSMAPEKKFRRTNIITY
jgi:hypothetical protein